MVIRRHIPSYFDQQDKPEVSYFNTKEELLAIPWVHNFSRDNTFVRFSLAKETLVAEYTISNPKSLSYDEILVVGFIQDQRPYKGPCVDLPEYVTLRNRV